MRVSDIRRNTRDFDNKQSQYTGLGYLLVGMVFNRNYMVEFIFYIRKEIREMRDKFENLLSK
jgi:hypothetical protein